MSDAGSIVLGWLTKLVVTMAILGLLAFDGIALVVAGFNAADQASTAASLAADDFKTSKNPAQACQVALVEAVKDGDTLNCSDPKAFQINAEGQVTVLLHRTATTLWMHRVSFLKKYTDLTGSGQGSPSP